MTKKEKRKYQVREIECYDRNCFVPFNGNGIKICRLYEMGQCPKEYIQSSLKNANCSNNNPPCLECGEPNGKHLPGCKMPKID